MMQLPCQAATSACSSTCRLRADVVLEPSAAQCHYLLTVMRQRAGDEVGAVQRPRGRVAGERSSRRSGAAAGWPCSSSCGRRRRSRARRCCSRRCSRTRQEFLVEKATELGVGQPRAGVHPALGGRPGQPRAAGQHRDRGGRAVRPADRAGDRAGAAARPSAWRAGPRAGCCIMPTRPAAGSRCSRALRAHGAGRSADRARGRLHRRELAGCAACEEVVAISLGPRILRAETAALAALACWQAFCGPGLSDAIEDQPAAAR